LKNFLDKKFVKSPGKIVGAIIGGIFLLGMIIYASIQENYSLIRIGILIIFWLAIVLLQLISFKINKIFSWFIYILLPFITFLSLELFTHLPFKMEVPIIILNTLILFAYFIFFLFLFGSSKIGGSVGLAVLLLFGIVNCFVLQFRSSPIVPWDIYSIRTAVSVVDNYTFIFTYKFIFTVLSFVFLIVMLCKTSIIIKRISIKLCFSSISIALLLLIMNRIQEPEVKQELGLFVELFSPTRMQQLNGVTANFLMSIEYMSVEKPDNYSVKLTCDTLDSLLINSKEELYEFNQFIESADTRPNIIVIMNEAFSDLSIIGDFTTNEDYMPFIHSMKDDTIKGNVFVSVKGGNTANTEFEFLTGHSLAFLPNGSVPYQQFLFEDSISLAWQLKDLGYNVSAMHPYGSGGWNRYKVFPYLGFDEIYFSDSFENPEYIRNYISDREAYNKVIDIYESKDENDREFIFVVTMQNHGGYEQEYENFIPDISADIEDTAGVYQYLSLIKESDLAFEELVSYFREEEEDTIILMFGDHQPSDYVTRGIYEKNGLLGELTLEQSQNSYVTPFIIWANYDIEEKEVDKTSANFLSIILLQQAGIELTKYQEALLEISEVLPVITANIHIDSEGNYHPNNETVYEELLYKYAVLQYNGLNDRKNRIDRIFSIGR